MLYFAQIVSHGVGMNKTEIMAAFVTDLSKSNTVDPNFITSEIGHGGGNKNGAMLSSRRVCHRGELRWVYSLATGGRVCRIKRTDGATVNIYDRKEDVGS